MNKQCLMVFGILAGLLSSSAYADTMLAHCVVVNASFWSNIDNGEIYDVVRLENGSLGLNVEDGELTPSYNIDHFEFSEDKNTLNVTINDMLTMQVSKTSSNFIKFEDIKKPGSLDCKISW